MSLVGQHLVARVNRTLSVPSLQFREGYGSQARARISKVKFLAIAPCW